MLPSTDTESALQNHRSRPPPFTWPAEPVGMVFTELSPNWTASGKGIMASETSARETFDALGNLCQAALDNLWAETWCTAMALHDDLSCQKDLVVDPLPKSKYPKAHR